MAVARLLTMIKTATRSMALLVVVAWSSGGCAHQEPPANRPGDMPVSATDGGDAAAVSVSPAPPRATAGSADITTMTVSNGLPLADTDTANDVPSSAALDLTDAQILEVAHVMNRGEIEQAALVASRGRDVQVKKLAAALVREHAESDEEAMALAMVVGLLPARSPTSVSLEGQAKDVVAALKDREGVEFDHRYLDAQIKEHESVLDTLVKTLVPNAKNAELKAYLRNLQAKVSVRLQQAQTLQSEVNLGSRTSATR
jgi:putative membrane protein